MVRATSLVGAVGAGYLIGSLPFADLMARLARRGQVDLHSAGSGNPGALNAIDQLGPGWGVAVGIADVAKGAAATAVGRRLAGPIGGPIAGTSAVTGHCFPVWNRFQGGKGVATALGQMLATCPEAAPVAGLACATEAARRRPHPSKAITFRFTEAWVLGAVFVWARQRPDRWGERPTMALPLSAAASSAIVRLRFARDAARQPARGRPQVGFETGET